MPPLWDDPKELADAIARARVHAEMRQEDLAEEAGVSVGTVKRWEKGDTGTLGRKPNARRAKAILVAELTGAPREGLGLAFPSSRPTSEELAAIRQQLDAVTRLLLEGESEELREQLQRADAFARLHETSTERPEDRTSEGQNG